MSNERFLPVPDGLAGPLELATLVIQVEGTGLESGLVLTSRSGQELVIVAGVFPHSLAIAGLGEAPHRFEPEYPLMAYLRCSVMSPGTT